MPSEAPGSTTVAVSSLALRRLLGTLRIPYRDGAGQPRSIELVQPPAEVELIDLPARVEAELGVRDFELVQFQLPGIEATRSDLLPRWRAEGRSILDLLIDVGDLASASDRVRAESVEEMAAWIDVAGDLGCSFARVNPCAPGAVVEPGGPPEHVVSALLDLSRHAAERGIRLLVENHGGTTSDPAWMEALLDATAGEVGLLLDLGNIEPLRSAAAPAFLGHPIDTSGLDLEPVYDVVGRLAPRAEAVSSKTYGFLDDGTHPAYDAERALHLVRDAGFTGPVSIEHEGLSTDPWGDVRRALDLVRRVFP